jgi:FkbM family methyltransferase
MTLRNNPEVARTLPRVWRFFRKPWREKFGSFYARWIRIFPSIPLPVRLPFGAWFLARSDYMSSAMIYGGFELAEHAFVQRFLRPGMTVLDIGAHHGLYTLLASKLIGPRGKVVAFEPSPRERKALRLNVGMNRCKNVVIQGLALGDKAGECDLYVVDHHETGCNSLRPPAFSGSISSVSVSVMSLDQWLSERHLESVDFIKLDVEGGELAVLQGAQALLQRRPRPVILAEVQEVRTQPWSYPAKEIIHHLSDRGYKWFSLSTDGSVEPLDILAEKFDGNFVACPEESEALLVRSQDRMGRQEQ